MLDPGIGPNLIAVLMTLTAGCRWYYRVEPSFATACVVRHAFHSDEKMLLSYFSGDARKTYILPRPTLLEIFEAWLRTISIGIWRLSAISVAARRRPNDGLLPDARNDDYRAENRALLLPADDRRTRKPS